MKLLWQILLLLFFLILAGIILITTINNTRYNAGLEYTERCLHNWEDRLGHTFWLYSETGEYHRSITEKFKSSDIIKWLGKDELITIDNSASVKFSDLVKTLILYNKHLDVSVNDFEIGTITYGESGGHKKSFPIYSFSLETNTAIKNVVLQSNDYTRPHD
jgi:hypothetical protein